MARRSIGDLLGIYKRDGRVVFGRAPYLTESQWQKVEKPSRLTRIFAALGLAYSPDQTRRKPLGERTKD